MRNLLLLLLLANILYFLWGRLEVDRDEPGIVILDEAEFGPPLAVSANRDAAAATSVGAALGSAEPSDLAAVVGRSCVTIGPFKTDTEADAALARYAAQGMRTSLRSVDGEIFVGHWVILQNIANRRLAGEMLDRLHGGGLEEAYLVTNDNGSLDISLGLFGSLERAERVELRAKSLDLPAEIIGRTREGTLFFVDIGLPPGRGAGAMIEQYGEDKVLLRNAATCPRND